jgi:LytS/YehU family sensor histidine kinase
LWFPLGLLLAAQFQRSARERSAQARLDALLREQRQAQRRFAETRLQQIQSRIDPELLFEMLEHVRRLYPTDAMRAERLLDELIDFLRAVLPQLHSAASTLGREVRIAASYLRLRGLAEDPAVTIDLTLPAELAATPFPPGLMLSLVDALRRQNGSIGITAEAAESGCRVILAGAAAPDEATLGRLRAMLDALYGSRCRLELARQAQRTTLSLTLADEDRRD